MKTRYLEKEVAYDGRQLTSHWILREAGLEGNAIVAFEGPCHVALTEMVDLEDVLAQKSIHSESMLHFIVENFDTDLEKMILRQRLLITLIQQELEASIPPKIRRQGDDLYLDQFKLTVSIATASPVSVLIHAGINISSRNTPVPTKGLADFSLEPRAFGEAVLENYRKEMEGITWARCKVRPVA